MLSFKTGVGKLEVDAITANAANSLEQFTQVADYKDCEDFDKRDEVSKNIARRKWFANWHGEFCHKPSLTICHRHGPFH